MSDAAAESAAPARSRAGGRQGKREARAGAFDQPPFRQLKRPFEPVKYVGEEVVLCTYTSGTTGKPKGVLHKESGVEASHKEPAVER